MTRLVTLLPVAALVCVAGVVSPVSAQVFPPVPQPVEQLAAATGELFGVVVDDRGEPLAGAVVSALGATTAFAVTDRAGRFSFRTLPPGPYLVRAHLSGFKPGRAHVIQVNSAGRAISSIALIRKGAPGAQAPVLAGLGDAPAPPDSDTAAPTDDHDHSEVAWRLRHLKRSVLREASSGAIAAADDKSLIEDSFEIVGRAMGHSARAASSLFTELPVSGEVNLLTTASFDRPQELLSMQHGPRGVAFVSLAAPSTTGDWSVRGAMTQGDLASWLVAGSYVRRAPSAHQFEAGLSYAMQRYDGGNPAAVAAMSEGSRNAAEIYAYDRWTVAPRLTINYGAKYARYDYLVPSGLLSPRLSVIVAPTDMLRVRVTASRRAIAPGAEEFVPDAPGVWLPPERTFSPVSARGGFVPERVEHYEIAADHDVGGEVVVGVRAFRQRVADQIVTLFGVSLPDAAVANLGHYYVGTAGDLAARGWGVSVSRDLGGRVRGSVDYTRTATAWTRHASEWHLLSALAPAVAREAEALHDVTTSMQTELPMTATRVYVLYKLNSGLAAAEPAAGRARIGTRFDVQLNQALPFLNFTAAQWEMLLTVRNLFREDLLDASIYDELLVVRPPKRVVGGLTVRF